MSHDHHHAPKTVVIPEIPAKPSMWWRLSSGLTGRNNLVFFSMSALSLYLMAKFTFIGHGSEAAKTGSRYYQHSQDLRAGKDPYGGYRARAHAAH